MILVINKISLICNNLYNMNFINKLFRAYSFSLKEQTIEYLIETNIIPQQTELSYKAINLYKAECAT